MNSSTASALGRVIGWNVGTPAAASTSAATAATNAARNSAGAGAGAGAVTAAANSAMAAITRHGSTLGWALLAAALIALVAVLATFRDTLGSAAASVWYSLGMRSYNMNAAAPLAAPPPALTPDTDTIAASADVVALRSTSSSGEVFFVGPSVYSYDDAAAVCKAHGGAALATWEQLLDAHKRGADWCEYGWLAGQRAGYPTQSASWTALQAGPAASRNACGTPGVNGGYFDNPALAFGVNCYGVRPPQRSVDATATAASVALPQTATDIEFERKVQHFREGIDAAPVAPFSATSWSEGSVL